MSALPREVGIVADLIHIADTRAVLSNSLAIYDKVMIPVDAPTLFCLSGILGEEIFFGLVDHGRIEFCPAATARSRGRHEELPFSKETFLTDVLSDPLLEHLPDKARMERALVDTLIVPMTPTYGASDSAIRDAERRFVETTKQPGYEAFDYNRQVGLRLGLSRINDVHQVGYGALELDAELPILLNCAFPGGNQPSLSSAELIGGLHKVSNLPDLGTLAAQEKWDNTRLLNVLLSQEAADLRSWLRENLCSGMDVRDAYEAANRGLPSRNKWLGWMRFGSVAAVSTAVTSLMKSPVAGAVTATVIAAADQALGARVLDSISWKYHPNEWLSFVSRGHTR